MYSRMSWAATSGRVPIGAQHGRNRFMRPKRASSANMTRSVSAPGGSPRAFLTHQESVFLNACEGALWPIIPTVGAAGAALVLAAGFLRLCDWKDAGPTVFAKGEFLSPTLLCDIFGTGNECASVLTVNHIGFSARASRPASSNIKRAASLLLESEFAATPPCLFVVV